MEVELIAFDDGVAVECGRDVQGDVQVSGLWLCHSVKQMSPGKGRGWRRGGKCRHLVVDMLGVSWL